MFAVLRTLPVPGESPVIGDVRTVLSAMAAYASQNGGLYEGRLGCLARPTDRCLAEYPTDAPVFLDERITGLEARDGYRRTFHPGAGVPEAEIKEKRASPTSVVSWAYVAIPLDAESGSRSFCVDDTGALRFQVDVRTVDLPEGRCPEGWNLL